MVPFCFNLKSKIKQQEQAQRQRQDMLMIRRMANMNKENESQNQGPRTPGNSDAAPCKPGTPKSDHQPPTPNTQGPSTPGGSHGPSTPGSKLKQMVSPPGGKVLPTGMSNQQQRNPMQMMNASMQPGMNHPQNQMQQNQHQMNMGQPQQTQTSYPNGANRMNMYSQPPPAAVNAAKEAQILARQQASVSTKFPPQTNFTTRPGGTPSMPQRPMQQAPLVNTQAPWPAAGGRSPNDSNTYVHNQQGTMQQITPGMRVQPRPPMLSKTQQMQRKPQVQVGGMMPAGQIRKMQVTPQQMMIARRPMQQQQRPIITVNTA